MPGIRKAASLAHRHGATAMTTKEFREIGLSGGQVSIRGEDTARGRVYYFSHSNSRPVPSSLWAIWVIQPGIPVGFCSLGGIGSPMPERPHPAAFQVMMPSDSQGLFGRECPECSKYWRDDGLGANAVCPYCGMRFPVHLGLTAGQRRFVEAYSAKFNEALSGEVGVEYTLDLDKVAESVETPSDRPPFYFSEETQQHRYRCEACNALNDIMGNVGFCCRCGSRNDSSWLERERLSEIRKRLHSGEQTAASALRDTVSAFDGTVKHLVRQLLDHVPMIPARRARLDRSYHALETVAEAIRDAFGIDLFDGMPEAQRAFAIKMFHRRHVHEHNGGIVDQTYIDATQDDVRLGQAINETNEGVQRLTELVSRMVRTLVGGFHEILQPRREPIEYEQSRLARMGRETA